MRFEIHRASNFSKWEEEINTFDDLKKLLAKEGYPLIIQEIDEKENEGVIWIYDGYME